MASRKPRSVWALLRRLGHQGDRDEIIQHIFEMTSRMTLRTGDGAPIDGGDFLVSVFERLDGTTDYPACGSSEWVRLTAKAGRSSRLPLRNREMVVGLTPLMRDNSP